MQRQHYQRPQQCLSTILLRRKDYYVYRCYLEMICLIRANQSARLAKRKTISANDVLNALNSIEFDDILLPLKERLEGSLSR